MHVYNAISFVYDAVAEKSTAARGVFMSCEKAGSCTFSVIHVHFSQVFKHYLHLKLLEVRTTSYACVFSYCFVMRNELLLSEK